MNTTGLFKSRKILMEARDSLVGDLPQAPIAVIVVAVIEGEASPLISTRVDSPDISIDELSDAVWRTVAAFVNKIRKVPAQSEDSDKESHDEVEE